MEPAEVEESVPQKDNGVDDEDDDIDEEDVPGDFFDDFLKEDFMAGLDIVDEDEGDDEKAKKSANKGDVEDPKIIKKSSSKEKRIKSKKSKKKPDGKQAKKMNKKIKDHSINADEFDIRRDPKKTKRDIERDKARCEKDKEKKIITEKLKLVETGLVPPGMEMESDLEEIKKKEKAVHKDGSARQKSFTISLSPEKPDKIKNKISPRQRPPRSPVRRSPVVRRSPPRRSPRRSPPRWRSPRRSRSPVRAVVRRSVSPYYRARRPRHSPGYSRHSPDRDFFPRRRRSRSGSRSPKRRREEKKSFLQEIAEKLNETRHPANMMQPLQPLPTEMYHQPMPVHRPPAPVPAPAPVPPPLMSQPYTLPQPQQFDPYDQNFFIGGVQQGHAPHPVQNVGLQQPLPVQNVGPQQPHPVQSGRPQQPDPVQQNILPSPTKNHASVGLKLNLALAKNNPSGPPRQIEHKEVISKLFHDKKITLTEFLAITAKPEVYAASPAHIQEKIKVITRCQEAIKILGNSEKKFSGPLVVCKSDAAKSKLTAEEKYRSPLIRYSQLKVPFTDVPKKDHHQSAYAGYINHLLKSIGLMNEIVVEIDDQEEVRAPPDACAPPAPQISRPKTPHALSKLVQTEAVRCAACEKRARLTHRSVGSQMGGEGATFSVGTQVREDDFYVKIPKNQSLASLTPAQLLAKSAAPKFTRNVDVDDFDLLLPRAGYGAGAAHARFDARPAPAGYPAAAFVGGGRGRPALDDRQWPGGYGSNYY